MVEINVVPTSNCPRCGGGDEFYNRPKVGDENGKWWWKCYNPDCEVNYYLPETGEVELVPTPEQQAKLDRRMEEFKRSLKFNPPTIQGM